MAKRDLPIKEFQDLLNVYVGNGWFPWKHKIVKNDALVKLLVVQPDGQITFTSHLPESDEVVLCNYSVADLFSVESGLHDFVSRKTRGQAWHRDGQPPIYDVGYSFQYMNMATLTLVQRMEYFLRMVDVS